jgi:hypothetical protein
MSDSTLLVPVDVTAMVVTGRSRNFRRWPMVYENLGAAAAPEGNAFEYVDDTFTQKPENQGVYLAWTLPDGLRRGRQDRDTGAVTFPPIPNRWLVVRYHGDAGARQAAAWVVESDYVWPARTPDPVPGHFATEDDPGRSARFLDPRSTGADPVPVRLGRKVPLGPNAYREPGHPGGWLTAVAPGNLSFSAFQPHNQNVLSIHDELALRGVPAGTLSYFVAGWYAQPGDDPLAGWDASKGADALHARLQELGWTLTGDALPRRILCHGTAPGVKWQPGADLAPDLPDQGAVRLAVGNTSIDALTALVEAQVSEDGKEPEHTARLLEAFQYGLLPVLDQPGGDAQLDRAIRDAWFGSSPAGTHWEVSSADPELPSAPGEVPPPPPPPPSAAQLALEAQLLDPLNAAQARLDAADLKLAGLQRELFELAWKARAARAFSGGNPARYPWRTTPAQFQAALGDTPDALPARVLAAATEAADARSVVSALSSGVMATGLSGPPPLPAGRVLKASATPRFWAPSDPVILVAGARQSGTLRPRDARACRTPDQVVASIPLTLTLGGASQLTRDHAGQAAPAVQLAGLPDGVEAVLREAYLLDPGNAAALAQAAWGRSDDATIAETERAILQRGGVTGQIPDLELGLWTPPWLPLFLEWQVSWYPIPFQAGGGALWAYDGHEYQRAGNDVPAPQPRVLSGRSVLTPRPEFQLRARIKQYTDEHPGSEELAALSELIERKDGWDLLSQTLSGLHAQIALRDPRSNLAPDRTTPVGALGRTLGELVAAGEHSVPQSIAATGKRFDSPSSSFEGMRAGQLVFTRVAVVDRFGQTLEVTPADPSHFVPLRAPALVPTRPVVDGTVGTAVQLGPRLLQPARLTFEWTAPHSGGSLRLAAGGSPLCGWLLPNHLDRALGVYDADGAILGELRPAAQPDGTLVPVWDPAPGMPAPGTVEALRTLEPHLGELVAGLVKAGAAALSDFLDTIDETTWSVDPLGDRSDLLLNALIGRPLAVVRAAVGLELMGEPLKDPSWPFTFAPVKAPFAGYSFDVELGDVESRRDGLMGYFTGDDYSRFNATHPLPGAAAGGYLAPIGEGNRLSVPLNTAPGAAPVGVTLVLDPRGTVSARCGILPQREIGLPARYVEGPMAAMQATFRTGPLLAVLHPLPGAPVAEGTDPDRVPRPLPYPLPAERNGVWEWVELLGSGPLIRPLAAAGDRAELSELPASLREGHLRFLPREPQP